MLRGKVIASLVLFLGLGAIVGYLAGWGVQRSRPAKFRGREIPRDGILQFPHSESPGDIRNAERDFKVIYAAIDRFRKVKKRLPTEIELTNTAKELLPGFRLSRDDFENPDNKFRELHIPDGTPFPQPYAFNLRPASREDLKRNPVVLTLADTERPAFPAKGKRYVWAETDIYVRTNSRVLPNGAVNIHYSGCYVVLWSDGSIERVPQSKRLFLRIGNSAWRLFYPGAADVPREALPVTLLWEERRSKLTKGTMTWE